MLDIKPLATVFPWMAHPAFQFNSKTEGFENWTFGGRAGPSIDYFNLFHELAHAIELPENKWEAITEHGWPFNVRQRYIGYDVFDEPLTSQITARECRVFGIQKHIAQQAGMYQKLIFDKHRNEAITFEEYCVKLTSWLPDWIMGGSSDEERNQFRLNIINETYKNFNPNDINKRMTKFLDWLLVDKLGSSVNM